MGGDPGSPSQSVVLVTGARKGIGRFLAESYANRGFRVIGCSRSPAEWSAPAVEYFCADITVESNVVDLLRHIRHKYGRLDILINNAGVASMNHSLLVTAAAIDNIMGVNFRGTFLATREAAKLMRRSPRGRIVNLTSVAVPLALEGESVYAASKAAVETLTRILAKELAPFNITVNALGPSPVATDLIHGVPDHKIARLLEHLPMKRMGTMEDVLNAIDFFISPSSDAITGQILYLGGA